MTADAGMHWKMFRVALVCGLLAWGCGTSGATGDSPPSPGAVIESDGALHAAEPVKGEPMSLKQALSSRRSIRVFNERALTDKEISELLWAAQGITGERGGRTAPSAGATYPLEIRVVTRRGVYRFAPARGDLEPLSVEDRMAALAAAALHQDSVRTAGANFVVGGVVPRTAQRYGDRAGRYVTLEAGCASENLMLMATALGLGSVMIGAYDDDRVREIAMLPEGSVPYAIIAVGAPGSPPAGQGR